MMRKNSEEKYWNAMRALKINFYNFSIEVHNLERERELVKGVQWKCLKGFFVRSMKNRKFKDFKFFNKK